MALYYTLPVYKASYKLVILLFANSENFAREYKYTVGQDLKNEGSMLIKNIYRANKAMDKIPITFFTPNSLCYACLKVSRNKRNRALFLSYPGPMIDAFHANPLLMMLPCVVGGNTRYSLRRGAACPPSGTGPIGTREQRSVC